MTTTNHILSTLVEIYWNIFWISMKQLVFWVGAELSSKPEDFVNLEASLLLVNWFHVQTNANSLLFIIQIFRWTLNENKTDNHQNWQPWVCFMHTSPPLYISFDKINIPRKYLMHELNSQISVWTRFRFTYSILHEMPKSSFKLILLAFRFPATNNAEWHEWQWKRSARSSFSQSKWFIRLQIR